MKYYDKLTLERIRKGAHPSLSCKMEEDYLECNNKIVPTGYRLRFSHVLRTDAEQNSLYEIGRTKPGSIVTNAKAGQSYHNYGLAFDIVVLQDIKGNGSFTKALWTVDALFMKIVRFFESKGWKWGGRFGDNPHFDYTFGYNWRDLKEMKKDKDGFVILNKSK